MTKRRSRKQQRPLELLDEDDLGVVEIPSMHEYGTIIFRIRGGYVKSEVVSPKTDPTGEKIRVKKLRTLCYVP